MRKFTDNTPERMLNDELWEMALPHRSDTLPKNECKPGYLYWGDGGGEVDLAICEAADKEDELYFRGVRETRGGYDLFTERHPMDTGMASHGWAPIVELELVPSTLHEKNTILWLLKKEIEVIELKVSWHEDLPQDFHTATDYQFLLNRDITKLHSLRKLSEDGPTFLEFK